MLANRRSRISQYSSHRIRTPWGVNSLCTIPEQSKNTTSIEDFFAWPLKAFLGLGSPRIFHCWDDCFVSGSYRGMELSSPVMTISRRLLLSLNICKFISQRRTRNAFCSSDNILGTNLAATFDIANFFLTIVWTEDLLNPVCALRSRTVERLSWLSCCWTCCTFCCEVAEIGRPVCFLSWMSVSPPRKCLCQCLTCVIPMQSGP